MKNIVYILVDALFEQGIKKEIMPFLAERKNKSFHCKHMYSLAPYTEAALISTLCGERTLEHGDYFNVMQKCEKTLFELLNECGYHTISTFAPYIQPSSFVRGIDDYIYVRPFGFRNLLLYRIDYMAKKKQLTETDFQKLKSIVYDSLICMYSFCNSLIVQDNSVALIEKYINYNDVVTIKDIIAREIEAINLNDKEYISNLLELNEKHIIFHLPEIYLKYKNGKSLASILSSDRRDALKDSLAKAQKFMQKNNKLELKRLYNMIRNTPSKEGLKKSRTYIKNVYNSKNVDIAKTLEKLPDKVTLSAGTILDYMQNRIKELDKDTQPFFAYIHLEDFHYPSAFYSYDSLDDNLIKEEIEDAIKYINENDISMTRNIETDLGLHYIDKKLSLFIHNLEKDLKENTLFVITADHGYSYSNNPVRETVVNNFYNENYHVPFYIFDNYQDVMRPQYNETFYYTFDINPTILNYLGIEKSSYCGKNIALDEGRDILLIEYLGPGCPDLSQKEIFYCAFDSKYKVGVKICLSDSNIFDKIVDVYDLEKDPYEKKNLRYRKEALKKILSKYVELIEKRHFALQQKLK